VLLTSNIILIILASSSIWYRKIFANYGTETA